VASDESVFAKLGINPTEPFVLFVGVLRYYKGLHVLLNACRHVAGRVVMAGAGPELSDLQSQALALGLKNVVFAGQVTDSEKIALLRACRCLVLPSHLRSEAYGMVLVEASIMGKPMVSCEIGTGTSFVNRHEETGFVVPPESPEALAHAMSALLGDRALAEKFGHAARRRYEALFSGPALGKAYTQLYQDVVKN
jgi:rhamnosyl/mannosyltransferase